MFDIKLSSSSSSNIPPPVLVAIELVPRASAPNRPGPEVRGLLEPYSNDVRSGLGPA